MFGVGFGLFCLARIGSFVSGVALAIFGLSGALDKSDMNGGLVESGMGGGRLKGNGGRWLRPYVGVGLLMTGAGGEFMGRGGLRPYKCLSLSISGVCAKSAGPTDGVLVEPDPPNATGLGAAGASLKLLLNAD